jgi:hypothetical protein
VTKFTKRHPEIKSVMGARLDKERWNSVTRESMEGWFNLLKSVKEEYRILDSNIYNMDEKGCILGISEKARVLIPSSSRVKYIKQAGDRESVTVIECIRSSGVAIPPFVIWKAHTHRDNWVPVTMRQSMDGTAFATSPNGYTDHELGFEWLRTIFHPATVQSARGHTRLLIMDGHSSHLTSKFLGFCHDYNILPLCLPPHTTHLLQPLDVGCFAPLAHYYRVEVDEATQYGLHGVSKYDFLQFYSVAREKAFKAETIHSAYRKAGIVPTDPEVVLQQLIEPADPADPAGDLMKHPALPSPPSRPGSSTSSVPTPRDYAKLIEYCGRLEEYVRSRDNQNSPSQRLSNKVYKAVVRKSAEFTILEETNAGLTKVITAKKERRKLRRRVISTGRVLTLVQVHEIREEEKKRQTEKKKRPTEGNKNMRTSPKRKNTNDMTSGHNKRLKSHCEEPRPDTHAIEPTENLLQTTASTITNKEAMDLNTSYDTCAVDNISSVEIERMEVPNLQTPALLNDQLPASGGQTAPSSGTDKVPRRCSGCGSFDHNYRKCPNRRN